MVHPVGKSQKIGFPSNHPEKMYSTRWLIFKKEKRASITLYFTWSLEQSSDHLTTRLTIKHA